LTVHCPVRDPSKESKIKHLKECSKKGTLKFFQADLLEEGSYLESMKGCSVVFHTASPFVMGLKRADVQKKLLGPAVQGTRNVLDSVSKTPSVKKVVLTSSAYAILTDVADCYDNVVTEETWNSTASESHNPYALSKKLAEQQAWKIADAQSQYKLTVVNPAWVMGPGLQVHTSSESMQFLKMLGDGTMKQGVLDVGVWMVDVRDVAQAHLGAAFSEKADGRYIISGNNTSMLKMAAPIAAKFPDYPLPTSSPHWILGWLFAPFLGMTRRQVWRNMGYVPTLDNSKSVRDLEFEYHSLETTMCDMFQQSLDAGVFKTAE
jgi:nucleoside-diphosphate-sugar epimerase